MQRKKFPAGLTAALTIFAATLSTNTTPALGQQETVLYTFSGPYGAQPYAGLIFDTFGNLYGTTVSGGGSGGGVVFELTPQAGGGWAEKVRHNFGSTSVRFRDSRCFRESLRHNIGGRCVWRRDRLRVDPHRWRKLDGNSPA